MPFISQPLVLTGQEGYIELDSEQWCALLSLGLMPEVDDHGNPLPGEAWKHEWRHGLLHDEHFPLVIPAEQAKVFAESLELSSAGIPEREEIGRVISAVDRKVDGEWRRYAVTTGRGWVETTDAALLFLGEGKDIIHETVTVLRSGPVVVDLASRVEMEC